MNLESGIRKSYKRDKNGQIINEIFFDEIRNVKVMSIEYEYNPDGILKKEIQDDGFGNCVEILYSYDERGNCTEIRETEYNNGKQSYCHTMRNFYDNKNRIIKEKDVYSEVEYTRELFYDNNGNLIKSVVWDEFGCDLFIEYEYDSSGNMTKKTEYTPEGEISCVTSCSYNEVNQLVSQEYNSACSFHKIAYYFYDEQDFIIKKITKYINPNNKRIKDMLVVEHSFINDQKGRVIYSKNKNDDFAEIAYFYNEEGRLVIHDFFNEKNGQHYLKRYVDFGYERSTTSWFEYVYDSDGKLVSENMQKIDGT